MQGIVQLQGKTMILLAYMCVSMDTSMHSLYLYVLQRRKSVQKGAKKDNEAILHKFREYHYAGKGWSV